MLSRMNVLMLNTVSGDKPSSKLNPKCPNNYQSSMLPLTISVEITKNLDLKLEPFVSLKLQHDVDQKD